MLFVQCRECVYTYVFVCICVGMIGKVYMPFHSLSDTCPQQRSHSLLLFSNPHKKRLAWGFSLINLIKPGLLVVAGLLVVLPGLAMTACLYRFTSASPPS